MRRFVGNGRIDGLHLLNHVGGNGCLTRDIQTKHGNRDPAVEDDRGRMGIDRKIELG
ncbi:hypothetical protein D3C80_261810 [compost metagenome]